MVCDFNYDQTALEMVKTVQGEKVIPTSEMVLTTWVPMCRESLKKLQQLAVDNVSTRSKECLDLLDKNLDTMVTKYNALLEASRPESSREQLDIVFSHNDVQENNILACTEDKTQLSFIDFEYSGINYRGADLGNIWFEG